VQARHGRAEADAFLLRTKLGRDYLDDETRLVPVELWHAALVAFASRWGREAVLNTVEEIADVENLGVWTHVLRGAPDPATAFQQLDHFGGDQVWTERWRTLATGPGFWRGSLRVRDDAPHERDGLCLLARQAELRAVPLLFGLPPGTVQSQTSDQRDLRTFEVRFTEPGMAPVVGIGALGLVLGSFGAGIEHGLAQATLSVALGGAFGVFGGILLAHERRRRSQSRAQLVRIQTLERAATLREKRERGTVGFQEGSVLAGQYRLTEKLGMGANGAIWEAERLSDGTLVALKMLRAAVAHDTIAADRLRREAAALGLAWHPNVVEVYEDGHLPDGTSFLAMERLYGESLSARLRRVGVLSQEQLIPYALQVCDALGAVHAAGVVHRDVKPSNIFLAQDPAGGADHVKLLDFGVARVEWAETRITNANAPLGTPGYMSPEQEQGLEIDHRSDLFGLGGVLYECITGVPPPLRPSELWQRHEGTDSNESGVQRALQTIPPELRRVIERAMAPLPRDRFADARAMRDALSALSRTSNASTG
jgi:serine/threonine-protein kinase